MTDTSQHSPGDAARREAQTVGDEIREKGAEAAQAAKDAARSYAERAREEAYARGEHYRDYAADETGKVASALRKASQDLSSGSPQERFLGQMADTVADAADRMRGMSLNDVARDTTDFARRHPAAFLGGAALIGFAAARFMKASATHDDPLYLSGPDTDEARTSPAPSSEPIPSPATTPPSRPAASTNMSSAPGTTTTSTPSTRPTQSATNASSAPSTTSTSSPSTPPSTAGRDL